MRVVVPPARAPMQQSLNPGHFGKKVEASRSRPRPLGARAPRPMRRRERGRVTGFRSGRGPTGEGGMEAVGGASEAGRAAARGAGPPAPRVRGVRGRASGGRGWAWPRHARWGGWLVGAACGPCGAGAAVAVEPPPDRGAPRSHEGVSAGPAPLPSDPPGTRLGRPAPPQRRSVRRRPGFVSRAFPRGSLCPAPTPRAAFWCVCRREGAPEEPPRRCRADTRVCAHSHVRAFIPASPRVFC